MWEGILRYSLQGLLGLFLILLGWAVKKYLVPWLGQGFKLAIAKQIIVIADDVTDYFVQKYPDSKPAEWIDKAIDKIREIIGPKQISKNVAKRAVAGALERKKRLKDLTKDARDSLKRR